MSFITTLVSKVLSKLPALSDLLLIGIVMTLVFIAVDYSGVFQNSSPGPRQEDKTTPHYERRRRTSGFTPRSSSESRSGLSNFVAGGYDGTVCLDNAENAFGGFPPSNVGSRKNQVNNMLPESEFDAVAFQKYLGFRKNAMKIYERKITKQTRQRALSVVKEETSESGTNE